MAKVTLEFEKPIVELERKIEEMRKYSDNLDIAEEISKLEKKVDQLRDNVFSNLTRWQRVQLARHPEANPAGHPAVGLIDRGVLQLALGVLLIERRFLFVYLCVKLCERLAFQERHRVRGLCLH